MNDIKLQMKSKAADIEKIIYRYLPPVEGYQKTIFDAMDYSLKAGGKRLRPMLMNETFKMLGGSGDVIEPFMAAIEMIHTYSLVHDDLPAMDNDMLRRGKPTTHAVYGEAMGVLAGDALLNYAFETALLAFDKNAADAMTIAKALKVLSTKAGVYGMIGGQVVDVESEKNGDVMDLERVHFVYELKTGALIEASMMIGAILAGADDNTVSSIETVALNLGLAFQIQDDILDIEGDETILGKPIGSDEKNKKATYVSYVGLEKSKEKVRRLTDEAINELKQISGSNDFLIELMNYLVYRNN